MGLHLLELADGFSCYVSGDIEARNVYREIFQEHCYDGPDLPEAPVIVDVGAHIGLSCLYMKQKYPLSKIIAFEPAPETFEALRRNLELHGVSGVITYPYGLGSKSSTEMLTYYPLLHANSTFVPEGKELQKKLLTEGLGEEFTNELYANLQIPVPINRLSHFIESYHADVEKIDLLKIDVEGAELEVLLGVDDVHWATIRNVAMEVSDEYGALSKVERLLQSKGFIVTCEAQGPVEELKMYIVTACRDPVSPD
jgi:FkbM family methyltransferase